MSNYAPLPFIPADKPDQQAFFDAVRGTLDGITGRARETNDLQPLPNDATPEQIIDALNKIISRLNG